MIYSAVRRGGRPAGCVATLITTLALLALPGSAAAATLGLSASSAPIGQTIQASAELSEGQNPTGSISFEVFGPDDPTCAGPALLPTPTAATVAGNGSYQSGTFTPAVAGTYRWSAQYSGDAENPGVVLATCAASSSVAKATPALTGSASSAVIGGAIKDEATLSGAFSPTGEVTFKVFGPGDPTCAAAALATDTAPIVAGKATADDFVAPSPGEYHWTASYPGDANNVAVEMPCGTTGQSSAVSKATPLLTGTATSAVKVGLTITDTVVVSAAVVPSGELIFRAYGPNDPTCASPPAYEKGVPLDNGNGSYAPDPYQPPTPGLYLWTVTYAGDANNAAAATPCGAENQASAVGTLDVTLAPSAGGGTIGSALTAAVTLGNGATPGGQLTFKAFAPGDPTCGGAAAFSSTVAVKGNRAYTSASFTPSQVGTYRWTVSYSGDVKHAATSTGCGAATSVVAKANPTIAGKVGQKLTVGTRFRDTATLGGGFSPGGTITFEIYLPGADRCDKPDFVNTVPVSGNGTYSSDPFVAKQAGRYRFIARYSGDASNQVATEACGSPDQLALVGKRIPKLRPLAKLIGPQQISIRASLAGASAPAGVVSFRLFAPGDRRCSGRPAFAGSLRVRKNGTFTLAEYIATKPGVYRLGIGYSGDPRNAKSKIACAGTQPITVRG